VDSHASLSARRALALYASHDRRRRLKALGNAVVPQQIYPVLEAIAQELRGDQEFTLR
jgi:hypothetical protein